MKKNAKVSGALGGKARAQGMTKTERSAASSLAAKARWSEPKEVASGELKLIPGSLIPCAVLDNGKRVLSTRGVSRAFGSKKTGTNATGTGAPQPPPFLASSTLKPFLSDELIALLNSPIVYRPAVGGRTVFGYDCAIFPMICKAVISADRAGALRSSQSMLVTMAHAMLDALVGVAMVALVDEATGYQYDRDREALALILEQFLDKKLAAWVKTFPDEYYQQLCKLRGVEYDEQQRPQYFGHLTNELVYSRLAPGVLKELRAKNPRSADTGRRKNHHHRWLTRDVGHPELKNHLLITTTLMKLAPSYEHLVEQLDHVAPRFGDTLPMFSFAQMQAPVS